MGRKSEGMFKEGERLLTEEEVAQWLNVSLHSIRNMRYKKEAKGPPHTKVGGAVRYSPSAIRQYLEGNTQDPSEKFILDIERKASVKGKKSA